MWALVSRGCARLSAHSVKASVDVGSGDALKRQDEGGGAQGHSPLLVDLPHRRKGLHHDPL